MGLKTVNNCFRVRHLFADAESKQFCINKGSQGPRCTKVVQFLYAAKSFYKILAEFSSPKRTITT